MQRLLCSNCHGSEKCTNVEETTYEELSDSEGILDEEPTQTTRNANEDEDDDDHDKNADESCVESEDELLPSKKIKLM